MKFGVFDSGLGGLTVLKHLVDFFPEDDFFYLGDTARLPYGTKTSDTIYRYSNQILNFLEQREPDAFVIACNTASSHYQDPHYLGHPVFNVITPGAQAAASLTKNKKIGVIATQSTISSGSYDLSLKKINPDLEVISQSCPLFVPLVEEGWLEDSVTDEVASRYLEPLKKAGIDTLILGCTHYPWLSRCIQKTMGPDVKLVDSGLALALEIKFRYVTTPTVATAPSRKGHIQIMTTDDSTQFAKRIRQFLPNLNFTIETVNL